MFKNIAEKLKESLMGVFPVTLIILIVNSFSPMSKENFTAFFIGAILLILGLALYNIGSGSSIEFMGGLIGTEVSKSKKLPLILAVCGTIGFIVTIAEPDLAVLAEQVNGIDSVVLIGSVALGVGVFMIVAVLRFVFKVELKWVLLVFYGLIFVLMFLIPGEFVPLAFDSSGVTTGPVTVPFIIALGTSLSATLGGKDSQDSSFGMVGICSIGPILAVTVLSLFCNLNVVPDSGSEGFSSVAGVFTEYGKEFPFFLKEILISVSPIVVFFLIYNFAAFKLSLARLARTLIGVVYVYFGLVLFLLGANMGFVPAGRHIGDVLAATPALLIVIGAVLGAVIVLAEPAVHVLTRQVEEVTGGVIKRKMMLPVMCISMAISVGLAMLRIVFDIDIKWVLLVGFGVALGLTFVVPKIFTGIAFDSGGVASGAMTAAFLLPLANGATYALYGDSSDIALYVMTDAFGVVAMVAMTPLVAIQVLGLKYKLHTVRLARAREEFTALLAHEGEVVELEGFASWETVITEVPALNEKVKSKQKRRRRNNRGGK
ncbi:MAG: DUF1538 domain-containing protein [Clostridia bacterium]|nr:DUF1538 domain-containing protein [Clostridia bacterium]